jgi:hypothetical protein
MYSIRSSLGNSDIALVELEEDLVLGEFIQTVALPPRGFSAETGNSTVAGWGNLEAGGSSPDILNKVVVPLVPLAECIELCGGGSFVDETNICAGLPEVSHSKSFMVCREGFTNKESNLTNTCIPYRAEKTAVKETVVVP